MLHFQIVLQLAPFFFFLCFSFLCHFRAGENQFFFFSPLDSRSPIGSRTSFAGMTKKENGKNMGETPVLRKSQF